MVDYLLHGADYTHVALLDSPFKRQRDETIETYLDQPATEDILMPFRKRAGIPTDARGMTGWGLPSASTWARMPSCIVQRATGGSTISAWTCSAAGPSAWTPRTR